MRRRDVSSHARLPMDPGTGSPFFEIHFTRVLPLFGLVGVLLAISSMRGKCVTYDEVSHLTAGYTYWRTGDFRMTPDHPPLVELLAAVPLLTMHLETPSYESEFWKSGFVWGFGRRFLDRPNDVDAMLFRARLVMVALWCAGGILAALWSRRLFGAAGGLVTAGLWFLCPNLIAHGRLVTTDVPAGVFFLAGLLTFCALIRRVTVARFVATALALGGLFLTKFSAPLIVPVLALLAVAGVVIPGPWPVRVFRSAELRGRRQRAFVMTAVALMLGASTVTMIWGVFGFRYSASPGEPPGSTAHWITPPRVHDPSRGLTREQANDLMKQYGRTDVPLWEQLVATSPRAGRVILWARDHRLLPEAYLYGLAYTVRSTSARWSYICGRVGETGWWYYFPVAWAIKTPLPELGVIALTFIAAVRRGFRPSHDRFVACSVVSIVAFAAMYAVTAVTGSLNIGYRHLLPVQMALFVVCGFASCRLENGRRRVRAMVPGLIGCLALSTIVAWPDYIPFFNAAVGGSRNGWKYLADSNVDWGQDLPALARYLKHRNIGDARIAYFGMGRPEYYGIRGSYFVYPYQACRMDGGPPGPLADFGPGTYVISATALQGWGIPYEYYEWTAELSALESGLAAQLPEVRREGGASADPELRRVVGEWRLLRYARLLHALRHRVPDGQVGHSILVYSLTRAELESVFRPPSATIPVSSGPQVR